MISERSFDSEDWSNDAEKKSSLNYILRLKKENS